MIPLFQSYATPVIALMTVISNILFAAVVIGIFAVPRFRVWVYAFVYEHILLLLTLASLSATVGSLIYSQLVGFPPCELCWVQRIFMYPQTILAFMAYLKRDRNIISYLVPLSVLGGLVALYHSYIQWGGSTSVLGCTSVGGECNRLYVYAYGYVTIPFMALCVFVYLLTLILIYRQARKQVVLGQSVSNV